MKQVKNGLRLSSGNHSNSNATLLKNSARSKQLPAAKTQAELVKAVDHITSWYNDFQLSYWLNNLINNCLRYFFFLYICACSFSSGNMETQLEILSFPLGKGGLNTHGKKI